MHAENFVTPPPTASTTFIGQPYSCYYAWLLFVMQRLMCMYQNETGRSASIMSMCMCVWERPEGTNYCLLPFYLSLWRISFKSLSPPSLSESFKFGLAVSVNFNYEYYTHNMADSAIRSRLVYFFSALAYRPTKTRQTLCPSHCLIIFRGISCLYSLSLLSMWLFFSGFFLASRLKFYLVYCETNTTYYIYMLSCFWIRYATNASLRVHVIHIYELDAALAQVH